MGREVQKASPHAEARSREEGISCLSLRGSAPPRETNRIELPLPPGDIFAGRHGAQVGPNALERLGPDAADAAQLVVVEKGAALAASFDDPLRQTLANFRQLRQLGPIGLVDVDQEFELPPRLAIDFDQAASRPALNEPIRSKRDERAERQAGDGGLIGASQEPRRTCRRRFRVR